MTIRPGSLARLCVTDRRLCPDIGLVAACLRAVVRHGATAILLRELDLPRAEAVRTVEALRAALPAGILVLVARDPVLAAEAGADGVQLGFDSPSVAFARDRLGSAAVIGRSVHAPQEAEAAALAGVDYVVFGPVRDTPSKQGLLLPRGFDGLSEAVRRSTVPVVAIGGLTAEDESAVRAEGAVGFAAIRAFMAP